MGRFPHPACGKKVKKGHFSPQFTFTMAAIKPDRRPWPLSGRSGKFASGGDAASLTEREAVRDLFPADWKPKIRKLLLGFDARVDSGLYRSLAAWREAYERFSTFMDRFHVAGWRRWLSELVSEAATLGTAGAILLLARHTGIPRDLGRRVAEEVGTSGDLPRPLRQRGRHPRHPP
jgi:hypothetical protein